MLLMMSWREAVEIKAYLCQGLAEGASPREPLQRWLLHLLSVAVPRHDRQSSPVMSPALDSCSSYFGLCPPPPLSNYLCRSRLNKVTVILPDLDMFLDQLILSILE